MGLTLQMVEGKAGVKDCGPPEKLEEGRKQPSLQPLQREAVFATLDASPGGPMPEFRHREMRARFLLFKPFSSW